MTHRLRKLREGWITVILSFVLAACAEGADAAA